jgi:hypothetical protein
MSSRAPQELEDPLTLPASLVLSSSSNESPLSNNIRNYS